MRIQATRTGPTQVRFTFPCGHSITRDYSKGPVAKRVGKDGLDILMASWTRDGLSSGREYCRPCRKAGKAWGNV